MTPPKQIKVFQPSANFFGRRKELADFERVLADFKPDQLGCRKILVHGRSGMGKTLLLQQYQEVCKQLDLTFVILDLKSESVNSFSSLLVALRDAFQDQVITDVSESEARKLFSPFDQLFKRFNRAPSRGGPQKNHPESATGDQPSQNFIGEPEDKKKSFWNEFMEDPAPPGRRTRGLSKAIYSSSPSGEKELISKEELTLALCRDLLAYLNKRPCVIFLDSYERLKFLDADIFQHWAAILPPSFFLVIGGQLNLTDEEAYPHWQSQEQQVLSQEITRLSGSETRQLIEGKLASHLCSEEVMEMIEEQTQGIPILLALVLNSVSAKSTSQELIDSFQDSDMKGNLDDRIITLVGNWLNDLPTAQKDLLLYASVLRKFNEHLVQNIQTELTNNTWKAFIRTNFVIDLRHSTPLFSVHDHFRKHLGRYLALREEDQAIHQDIIAYYEPLIQLDDPDDQPHFSDSRWLENFREYIYHLWQVDQEKAVNHWLQEIANAVWFLHYDFALELLMSFEYEIDVEDQAWFHLLKKAMTAEKEGEATTAIGFYEKILRQRLTTGKVPLHAQCQDSIGSLYMNQGRWADARSHLTKVRPYFRPFDKSIKYATVHLHLAFCSQEAQMEKEKQSYAETAISEFRRLHQEKPNLQSKIMEAICLRILGQTTEADALFEQLELQENNAFDEEFLRAWFDHLCTSEEWSKALEVGERLSIVTNSTEYLASILEVLGNIHRDQMKDLPSALQCYEDSISANANHHSSWWGKVNAYRAFGSWDEVFNTLQFIIENIEEERVNGFEALGDLLRDQKNQPAEAIKNYRECLLLNPLQHSARLELIETLVQSGLREEALAETGHLEEHAPLDNASLWEAIGNLYRDHLQVTELAIAAYDKSLDAEELRRSALAGKLIAYRQAQQWTAALDLLSFILENCPDQRAEALEVMADIYRDNLGAPSKALQFYRRCLLIANTRWSARIEWIKALLLLDRKREAEQMCAELVEHTLPEQADVWEAIGDLYQNHFEDYSAALAAYDKSLEAEPHRLSALGEKFNIYNDQEDWDAAIQLLELSIEHVPSAKANALEVLADIYRDNLGEPALALEFYDLSLTIPPRRSTAALGKVKALANLGWWEEARRIFEQEQSIIPASNAVIWEKVGDIYRDVFKDVPNAIQAYENSLSAEPNRPSALSGIYMTYRDAEHWEKAVEALQRIATEVQEDRATAFKLLGDIYQAQLGQLEEAVKAYQQSLAIEPESFIAKTELIRTYFKQDQQQASRQLLESTIRQTSDQDAAEWEAIGDIYRDLFNTPREALAAYRKSLTAEPSRMTVLVELVKTYMQVGENTNALAAIAQLESLMTPTNAEAWEGLGDLYRDQISDFSKAIDAYQESLQIEPSRITALQELVHTYAKAGQPQEAFLALEQFKTNMHRANAQIWEAIGDLYRNPLQEPEQAISAYDRSLEIEQTQSVLGEKLNTFRETGQWHEAAKLLNTIIENTPEDRAAVLEALGDTYHYNLQDIESAESAYRECLQLEPDRFSAKAELIKLFSRLGRIDEAQELFENLKGSISTESADDWELIGNLYRDQFQDMEEAVHAYGKSFELEPTRISALKGKYLAYQNTAQWHEAIRVLASVIELSDKDKSHALELLGDIHRDQLHKPEKALEAYHQALAVEPSRFSAKVELIRTLASLGRTPEAHQLMMEIIGEPGTIEAYIYENIGDLYRDELYAPEQALPLYLSALEAEPARRSVLIELIRTYSLLDQDEAATETMETLKSLVEPNDSEAYETIGDLYATNRRHPEEAIRSYQIALEIKSDNLGTWTKLLSAYYSLELWEETINTLEYIGTNFPDQQVQALSELAILYGQIGQTSAAEKIVQSLKEAEVDANYIHNVMALLIGDKDGSKAATTYWQEHDCFDLGFDDTLLSVLSNRVRLEMSPKIIHYFDPQQDSPVIPEIGSLRLQWAEHKGHFLPSVQARDINGLAARTYQIVIGTLEPLLFRIPMPFATSHDISDPEAMTTSEIGFTEQLTWLSEAQAKALEKEGKQVLPATEVILKNLTTAIDQNQEHLWRSPVG